MKARLAPVYFEPGMDAEFSRQLQILGELLRDVAEILAPRPLGSDVPDADAILFPQLLGDAFRQIGAIRELALPLLIITSEFGTVAMWDWEIVSLLKAEGKTVFTPYEIEHSLDICRSLAVKRELRSSKFVTYQDNPGEGFQAEIFKRFYWWEDSCRQAIKERFGVTVEVRSFKALGAAAREVPDATVDPLLESWRVPCPDVSKAALRHAARMYVALRKELDRDDSIKAMGINCLNESHLSNTTPCLAWSRLYGERGLIWGCEADIMSMMLQFLVGKCLGADVIMSNLYPFLVGRAALKHEGIDAFPEVEEPQNHLLVAHCGYFGLIPRKMAAEWNLRPKVLDIIDDEATAIDARLPVGPLTLAKMDLSFQRLQVIEGELVGYVQYPNSHCRNGGVLRIKDGHGLMNEFHSHHYMLVAGHHKPAFLNMARVFGLVLDSF